MAITVESITRITQETCSATFEMEAKPCDLNGDTLAGKAAMTGCLQIAGDWQGAVTVDCPQTLAKKIAGKMFMMEEGEITKNEMRDAMGELVNIVGGNIKNLLEGGNKLSLPSVTEGQDYSIQIPGSREVCRVPFLCESEILRITVFEAVNGK